LMKSILSIVMMGLALGAYAGGEPEEPLENLPVPAGEKVVVDGKIGEGEYDEVQNIRDRMAIYTQKEGEMITVGVLARTTGWIALGFGSGKMDGAHMLFGFVQEDGTVQFEEHLGQGWSHSASSESYAQDYALTLEEGIVSMEATVPLSLVYDNGPSFIYAYGPQANFTVRHSFRGSGTMP
jgi:hypothetical protein